MHLVATKPWFLEDLLRKWYPVATKRWFFGENGTLLQQNHGFSIENPWKYTQDPETLNPKPWTQIQIPDLDRDPDPDPDPDPDRSELEFEILENLKPNP